MQTVIKTSAIAAVLAVQPGARDQYLVTDLPGLAEAGRGVVRQNRDPSWLGGRTVAQSAEMVAHGDMGAVPASDAFLAELESLVFVSRAYRVIDDVCGAVPNIPNFIAGIPQAMRRRVRCVAPSAPLSVFADLTSSAGIKADDVRKRGMAILALVRLLANKRPVELWAIGGLGGRGEAHRVVTRIETAPLDLARAAHVLTCPSVSRGIMYGLIHERLGFPGGGWAYGNVELERKHSAEGLKRICNPGSDVLYIPAIHFNDQAIANPVAWIREMLAAYGGETVAE